MQNLYNVVLHQSQILSFIKKKKHFTKITLIFLPQTSFGGPSGGPGKLVVLESRTELDCLIEFINDEFDDPTVLRFCQWKESLETVQMFCSWIDMDFLPAGHFDDSLNINS